ncbi:hypothetical protein IQ249_02045 [Lusitaniella coriacea LEGE 07157]|uniref:Uncharacterized protein n=1 Tax=Lusitaniella coriacea LEGE 07157 TaxID=945747 RepID=A0A8J7DNI8_9CYAN|nr:hypothetical protein [Lusitaniella coriacea]MBE9114669.1 hypothetical protein [Lusitaniella coriacea LEGE 07157]
MSRNIRLFPTYSQKENQTTNHCLLILKMLYEENPKFLSEVLSGLLGENFSGTVGVQFIQQRRGKKSVPDGEITQEPFAIFLETKLGSNFDKFQLLGHLETLKQKQGQKVLLALGNFEQDNAYHPDFPEIESAAMRHGISFAAVSFEQFLQAIQLPYLPKNLVDAVSDLSEYFDENALLPSWKYRLDVVNCATTFDSVLHHKVYTCPAKSGSYSHRRSLYFGTYRNKCVERVAQIEAVVDIESEDEASLVWKNDSRPKNELEKIALERFQRTGVSEYPMRVFILGDLFPTHFIKVSSGGMQGSKQYFDIGKLDVIDAEDLAKKLEGKTWENYESF